MSACTRPGVLAALAREAACVSAAALLSLVAAGQVMAAESIGGDQKPVCALHPSEMPASPAFVARSNKKKPDRIQFARSSSCLTMADGSRIPAMLFSVQIAVPAQLDISLDNSGRNILAARVEALDEHFELVAGYPFDGFTRRGGMYTLSVFSNDSLRPIRYLLIRPDNDAVGRQDARLMTSMAFIPLLGGGYTHSYESTLVRILGESGRFSVEAKSLAEKPASD